MYTILKAEMAMEHEDRVGKASEKENLAAKEKTNLRPATYRTNVFFQSSMLMAGIQR
jgi:hypothetical protein